VRIIKTDVIIKAVAELCISANVHLGDDVKKALQKSREVEETDLACFVVQTILQNAEAAARENMPICQDTGMAVVFVSIGTGLHIDGNIENAINEGVRRGYEQGFLRKSIVADPINRTNTGDNTPAVIHYSFEEGENLKITVAPKGFGSENKSALKMLNPSDGIIGVENFVVETVKQAGSNPCPPIIVGVGVGGTMEKCALLAKEALLREVGSPCSDNFWRASESRLLSRINALNIGPAGFGGKTTALAVHILAYPTHIAGLPVAVNINCHVARHKEVVL
jgi:fumarate hydratase subunit alpha